MDKYPVQLGVAELQGAYNDPRALLVLANRIAALREPTFKHELVLNKNGATEFIIAAPWGRERVNHAVFAIHVAETLVLLRREWPGVITTRWRAIRRALKPALKNVPRGLPKKALALAVHASLVAALDEFDFDQHAMLSWALSRAYTAIRHWMQLDRTAAQPRYAAADDDIARNPTAIITQQGMIDEVLAELVEEEAKDLRAQLFERQRQGIRFLPAKVREVAKFRLLEDLTFREIAERLDVKLQTVVSRFNSAKRKLEAKLTPEDLELWREIKEDIPVELVSAPSYADTRFNDKRVPEVPPKMSFVAHLRTLSAKAQKQIYEVERDYALDHAEQLAKLNRLFAEQFPHFPKKNGSLESDKARAPARQGVTRTAAAYADGLRVTNLRGAKLSNAEIDQGTTSVCPMIEPKRNTRR
jgi:RNA polymerase sigma factor (sigma-70 family)